MPRRHSGGLAKMGLGAASGLTATLLALLLLPPVEGTLTSFSLLGEDSTKYGCLTQAYGEQKPESLKEPLEIQFVGSTNDCTIPDESTLNQEDVDKVSGKVAVFRMCSGATSFVDYYRDYFLKTLSLEQSGAVMVIPVEAWIAKLPEHMDRGELTESLNVPICIMELRVFDGLKLLMNEPGVQGDFSSLIFYNVASEPNFDTPITSITVDLNKNDHSFSLPATTSTFNNDTTPAITGTLLPLQLRPECYHRLEAQGALQGHISTCFSFYYHWAVIGARLLTDAVLIGGLSNTRLAIPGPYLVGTRTVPTFSIINMHSNTFSNLLSEQMEFGNVTVVLPALEQQQGPPYYAPVEAELGITEIGLWDDSPADSSEKDRHFECLAGQATFNPDQHDGSPAPWISSSGDIQPNNRTYRVVYVKPSADCGDEATCGRCLSKPTGKLDLDSSEDYGNFVILLHEDDFPCFLGHSEFSKAAVEAGPYALIVAQLGSSRHTVTDSNLARLAFPTFTVNKECGTRAIENCDPEAGLCPEALYVRLPKIENGVAVEGSTSYIEKEDEPGYIQFSSPEALKDLGNIPAGTANFNPKDHSSVSAPITLAQTVDTCNSQATCLECDRLEWRWKQDRSEFEGRIALFSRVAFDGDQIEIEEDGGYVFSDLHTVVVQGECLLPRGNIVEELQEAGSKGVIFVDLDDRILTYVQEGVPANRITIPSFNVPLYAGVRIIKHADEDPEARLPQVKGGVPVSPPVGESEGNSDGKGPNASDLTKSDLLLPGWAIALATVGGCLFLCGCGCTVYFVRRKRRMFAYNQMDSAVQADMMVDIMAMPGNGGFDDGGFHDEPLDNGDSNSDDENGHYGLAHSGNGGGGMQMVELGSSKQDAATGATDHGSVFP